MNYAKMGELVKMPFGGWLVCIHWTIY